MPAKSTSAVLILAAAAISSSIAAPIPSPNPDIYDSVDNSFTGEGGTAQGGSVSNVTPNPNGLLGGLRLLDAFSNNAGNGGKANSGNSLGGADAVGITDASFSSGSGSSSGSNSGLGDVTNAVGNSNSGDGGRASGGSVNTGGALIELFADNAGDAGHASSGLSGGEFLIPVRKGSSASQHASPSSNAKAARPAVAPGLTAAKDQHAAHPNASTNGPARASGKVKRVIHIHLD